MAEYLDVYDACGNCVGQALRSECHGNPALLHHTSHVVVLHPESRQMLLQKRRMDKLIQPGKWDTAVGGHIDPGESYVISFFNSWTLSSLKPPSVILSRTLVT